MAFDFTLTSGNKASRFRRSTSDINQTTQASANRQVSRQAPTVISDPGNDPLIGLAAGLGKFFGSMTKVEAAREQEKEQIRNDEAVAEAKRRVLQDPEGAKEAMRTGDYSKFLPDDELRTRKYVIENFQKVAAASAAQQEWHSHGEQFIAGLPSNEDPAQAWQEYIANKTEGANAIYIDQYFSTAMKMAGPKIKQWQNARYDHMVKTAEENAVNMFTEALKQQRINPSAGFSLEGVADSAFAGIPVPSPVREQMKRQAMGQSLRVEAARGNRHAMDIYQLQRVNPEDQSSPTWERFFENKGEPLYKLQEAFNNIDREETSAQTNSDIERITDEFFRGERSLGEAVGAVQYWIHDEGVSPQNDRLLKLQKMIAKQLKDRQDYDWFKQVLNDQYPVSAITPDQVKVVKDILDQTGGDIAALASTFKIPVGRAQKIADQLMAAGMMSDTLKQTNAAFIFDKGAQISDRMNKLNSLSRFSSNALHKILPAGQANTIVALIDLYRIAPKQAALMIQRLENAWEGGRNPTEYHRFDPKITETEFKKKVISALSGDVYKSMSPGDLKRIRAVASVLAVGMGDLDTGLDVFKSTYNEDTLTVTESHDGTKTYHMPGSVLGANLTADQLDGVNNEVKKITETAYVDGSTGVMGGNGVTTKDGMKMTFAPGFHLKQGKVIEAGEEIPAEWEGFMKSTDSNGRITLKVPPKPGQGDSHIRDNGNGFFMIWESGAWNVRYDTDGDLAGTKWDVPRNANIATQMLSRRLKQRDALQTRIDRLDPESDIAITADGVATLIGAFGDYGKLLEQKAELDAEIHDLVNASGANKQIVKLLKEYVEANGSEAGLMSLIEKLDTNPEPAVKSAEPEDVVQFATEAIKKSNENRRVSNHAEISDQKNSFTMRAMPHIRKHEGFSSKSYFDAGSLSIAYGWNLNNGDIRDILEDHGYNIKDLKDGKAEIDQEAADRIMPEIWNLKREFVVRRVGEDVWKTLSDVQRVGLTSLAYNADSLIGKGLRAALRVFAEGKTQGDKNKILMGLQGIDREIRYRSLPHRKMIKDGNAYAIDALTRRRNDEADMVLDGYLYDKDMKAIFPTRYFDWRTKYKDYLKIYWKKNTRQGFDTRKEMKKAARGEFSVEGDDD